ncbi:MAG: type II toxin-antitoxin system RelE/ParE family toxin [Candidatus Marinimicrobia bacterium]|nr:type II toxin-antitoxin system RelE/ParE family toxin [Candidatus Neomarinimicrobiota bacterium]
MIFVETSFFEKIREDYLNDDQYSLLQATLLIAPDAGAIIKGSGGIRKIRWSVDGTGKRGGMRVIYYWRNAKDEIHLLTVYRKSEVKDLTQKEIKAFRAIVKQIAGE